MTWEDKLRAVTDVVVDYFLVAREFLLNASHPYMPFIYVLSVVVSGALLWFTIYCISSSSWVKSKVIEKGMDYFGVGDVGKYRLLKVWKNVIKRLKTDNPSNWKIAIMEADHLMDEMIKSAGYRAAGADERFQQIEPEAFPDVEQLRDAHKIRNRIMREPDFAITKDEALRVLRVYQKAFRENGLLD